EWWRIRWPGRAGDKRTDGAVGAAGIKRRCVPGNAIGKMTAGDDVSGGRSRGRRSLRRAIRTATEKIAVHGGWHQGRGGSLVCFPRRTSYSARGGTRPRFRGRWLSVRYGAAHRSGVGGRGQGLKLIKIIVQQLVEQILIQPRQVTIGRST